MLSTTLIVPYSIEELCGMLQLLPAKSRETNDDSGPGVSQVAYVLMEKFGAVLLFCYMLWHRLKASHRLAHKHFLHFYGEPATHLDRGTSIYEKNKVCKCSISISHTQMPPLHCVLCLPSQDRIHEVVWRDFVDKIFKDWSHLTLYVSPSKIRYQRLIMADVHTSLQCSSM